MRPGASLRQHMDEQLQQRAKEVAAACAGPLLSVDTSSPTTSLALVTPQSVWCEHFAGPAMPSETLMPALVGLCDRAKVDPSALGGIVIGLGPGSFTGLRVGLATVKGVALGANIGIYGTSSLALRAAAQMQRSGPMPVATVLDARRGRLFAGVYAAGDEVGAIETLLADGLYQGDDVAAWLSTPGNAALTVGDGSRAVCEWAAASGHTLRNADAAPNALFGVLHQAERLRNRACEPLAALAPSYHQLSEAERQLAARRAGAMATT